MRKSVKGIDDVIRVVIYIRISMARENQTSTRTQEKECRAYAKSRGWEIVDVNIDEGKSAWNGKGRPGLDRTMAAIESKRANTVLVWKLDRFARSIIHFHELMGRIERAKGSFVSVTDQIDGSTTQGQIMMSLVAGFAQMESDIKSERAAVWQLDRIESGLPNGGSRAYGYEPQKNDTLIVREKESEILLEAATRILAGDSLRTVIRDLQPKSATGKGPMTARGLRSALTNPTVAGLRRVDDDFAPGNWTPIIPRDTWDALNALFGDPSRRTHTGTNELRHLLSGIMECDQCGKGVGIRKWKANPTARNPYTQESHRYTCQCGNSINADSATEVVMSRMWEIVTPAQWQAWKITGTGWDQSVIDGIRARRERILIQNLSGKIGDAAADEMLAECDRQEAVATGEEPLDLPDVADIRASWESLSVVDKRRVMRQAFRSIKLHASNGCRDPHVRIQTAA